MPRYMTEKAIDAGDGSGTNVLTSEVYDLRNSYGYCVQGVFSGGTPTGSLKVQGSINESTWVDVSTIAVTATGTVGDNKDAIYWPFIRVQYTGTAGTGVVVDAWLNTKGA